MAETDVTFKPFGNCYCDSCGQVTHFERQYENGVGSVWLYCQGIPGSRYGCKNTVNLEALREQQAQREKEPPREDPKEM